MDQRAIEQYLQPVAPQILGVQKKVIFRNNKTGRNKPPYFLRLGHPPSMPHFHCAIQDVSSMKLEDIFRDVDLLRAFQVYCAKCWSEESLYFLLSIRLFKDQALFFRIPEIVDEYLSPNSQFEINLPAQLKRSTLLQTLHWKQLEYSERLELFDAAYKHIYQMLKNTVFTNFKEDLMMTTLFKAPQNNKKKIVILGGGFCGITALKLLDPLDFFDIILIDTKEYFEYTPSMVLAITDPTIVHRVTIPYKEILKKGTFLQGYVSTVFKDYVRLGCWNVYFDYLVFSIGCSYGSTLKASNISTVYRNKKLTLIHRKLTEAKNILIVGGGLVGVEVAGEIITKYPMKNVVLLDSNPYLLKKLKRSASIKIQQFLEKLGVKIFLNERLIRQDPESSAYVTNSGRVFNADFCYYATGPVPNTEMLKKNFMDSVDDKGRVKVHPTLRMMNYDHIFAGGDVIDFAEDKGKFAAITCGNLIAKNICQMEGRKPLFRRGEGGSPGPVNKPVYIISLGCEKAMIVLPFPLNMMYWKPRLSMQSLLMKRDLEKSFLDGLRGNADWKGFSNLLPHAVMFNELGLDVSHLKQLEKVNGENKENEQLNQQIQSMKVE